MCLGDNEMCLGDWVEKLVLVRFITLKCEESRKTRGLLYTVKGLVYILQN